MLGEAELRKAFMTHASLTMFELLKALGGYDFKKQEQVSYLQDLLKKFCVRSGSAPNFTFSLKTS